MIDKPVKILLGNQAIAHGLIEAGCHIVTSSPGIPFSEIVLELVRLKKERELDIYVECSFNQKIAFEIALGASYTGKRAAVAMKQSDLNVALVSLITATYTGVKGGLVIISCDVPEPPSLQIEQNSRYLAMFAKVPVLDPSCPQEAKDLLPYAFELSEKYQIPVIFRPSRRVCLTIQSVRLEKICRLSRRANFDLTRWDFTPRYRLSLLHELNRKLELIKNEFETQLDKNYISASTKRSKLGIIASGTCFTIVQDILQEYRLANKVSVLKITTVYPLPVKLVNNFMKRLQKVLVLEEPDQVIETQIINKNKILGRYNKVVPREGELVPDAIYKILKDVLGKLKIKPLLPKEETNLDKIIEELKLPTRQPTLCPGCPHRASFYSIKKALPNAILLSDIGCYYLGLNLDAVDTWINTGGGITLTTGLYHAYKQDNLAHPIISTIDDFTFYQTGLAALINAVYSGARFVVVILDNNITAMTGIQPTPDLGSLVDGRQRNRVPLVELVEACGVKFVKIANPYEIKSFGLYVKEAYEYTKSPEGGMAVIIAKHPCPLFYQDESKKYQVKVRIEPEQCKGCRYCLKAFGCPGLVFNETTKKVEINRIICGDCGVCREVCPQEAIVKDEAREEI